MAERRLLSLHCLQLNVPYPPDVLRIFRRFSNLIRKANQSMLSPKQLNETMSRMREQVPLVHCITNDVVINFTANVLLAIGASPAMVIASEESADFARVASALTINVGTITARQAHSMKHAVAAAHAAGVPWVLDPVAYGALAFRTQICNELLAYHPTVIRGNAAEIAALSGEQSKSRGPDSLLSSDAARECAQAVARRWKTVVAMTGETDYVTNGEQTWALRNGHTQLTRVTGAGCALSAIVAAYCAVCETPMLAALCALSHMALAGEMAAGRTQGVGSFAVALLDELQLLADYASLPLRCAKA